MLKNTIVIGTYPYYTELYDADIDLYKNPHYNNFVMLRLFNIQNDIAVDTDIYFIEKQLFEEIKSDMFNGKTEITDKIVFPISIDAAPNTYSNKISEYNDNITYKNLKYQYYDLLQEDGKTLANIKCNKVRIYHPYTKSNLDAIVHIDNYINNIHFHYLCRCLNQYATNSEKEIVIANNTYSEFYEIWFPNIFSLFNHKSLNSSEYNTYYKEDLNIMYAPEIENLLKNKIHNITDDKVETYENIEDEINNELINKILEGKNIENDAVKKLENNTIQLSPLYFLLQPSQIVERNGHFVKVFLNAENNFITYPINITLFPYNEIDNTNNLYIADDNFPNDTETFQVNNSIRLASHIGFANGNISLIGEFQFPNKEMFDKIREDNQELKESYSSVALAYLYYYNLSPLLYNNFKELKEKTLFEKIDKLTENDLTETDIEQVKDYVLNYRFENTSSKDDMTLIWKSIKDNKSEILKAYKDMKKNTIKSELYDEFHTDFNFIGFRIVIASDMNFANIIYDTTQEISINSENKYSFNLDDFNFALNNIFNSWEEKNEYLCARVEFIDRIAGNYIISNASIITKEWFKYLVNDKLSNRIDSLYNINDKNMKQINLSNNTNTFNFLNNITCVINKQTDNHIASDKMLSNTSRVILQPYFYRANDLQTIKIRTYIKQNIGINLADYMSKIDSFILSIDGNNFNEIGRNDIYVIFKVDASLLNNTSGKYDIIDSDGNYLSTGNYSLY